MVPPSGDCLTGTMVFHEPLRQLSVSTADNNVLTDVYDRLETWRRQEVSAVLANTSPSKERTRQLVRILEKETEVLRKLGEAKRKRTAKARLAKTELFLNMVRGKTVI